MEGRKEGSMTRKPRREGKKEVRKEEGKEDC